MSSNGEKALHILPWKNILPDGDWWDPDLLGFLHAYMNDLIGDRCELFWIGAQVTQLVNVQ